MLSTIQGYKPKITTHDKTLSTMAVQCLLTKSKCRIVDSLIYAIT